MTNTKRTLTDEEIGLGKDDTTAPLAQKQKVLSDSDIGLSAPEPGAFDSVKDSAIALGTGVTQGIGMLANVAGADNAVSRTMADATQALSEYESPFRKAEKQERARKIKEAEASGSTLKEVGAYLGSFAEAPIDTTLNALGTSLPTLAAGFIPGAGQAAVGARIAQLGLGAAQGVGAVKGQIFDEVKQAWKAKGTTEEDAAARAAQAQSYTGDNAGSIALGGALGAGAGSFGAEAAVRRMAGKEVAERAAQTSLLKGAGMGALKEAPMEGLQGGQERLASNLALQNEGFDQGTWTGVLGSSALEATAAAPMGAGFGAWEAGSRQRLAQQEQQRRAEIEQQLQSVPEHQQPAARAQLNAELNAQLQAEARAAGLLDEEQGPPDVPPGNPNDYRATPSWAKPPEDAATDYSSPDDEVFQSTGANTQRPSEAMGLRTGPDAGPLENLAALSVDSGLSAQMQGAAAPAQEPAGASEVAGGNQAAQGQVAAQTNLREGLAKIRAQKQQEAANAQAATQEAAPVAPTVSAARPGAVEADGVERAKLLDSLDQAGATREMVLDVRLKDAQFRLSQAEASPNINRADQEAKVRSLNQEITDLTNVRSQARELDERDRREDNTRSMLRGARQELDAAVRAGAITPEAAKAVASNAKNTGNAADASEAIFAAVDSSTTGVAREPQTAQAQQAIAQPAQAGAAQATQTAPIIPNAAPNAGVEQAQTAPAVKVLPAGNAAQNQAQAPAAPQQTPTWATMPPEARQQVIQAAGLKRPQATKALATNSIEEMPAAIADKLAPVLTPAAGEAQQAPVPELASFEAKTALLRTSPELVDANGNLNERGNKIARTPWGELSQQEREVVVGLSESRRKANDSYNAYVREQEFQAERRRLQSDRIIQQANGKPFKKEASAQAKLDEFDLADTHAIQQVDGGFVLRQMPPAEQAERRRKAEGRESYIEAQTAVLAEMGIGENADGEIDATEEQWAEIDRRTAVRLGQKPPKSQPAVGREGYDTTVRLDAARLPEGTRLETGDRGLAQGMVRYVDSDGNPLSDWAEDEADAAAMAIEQVQNAPKEKLLRDHFVAASNADAAMHGNDAAEMLRLADQRDALVKELVDAGYTQAEIGANSLGISVDEFNRLVKGGVYSRERGAPDSLFPKRSTSRKAAAGPGKNSKPNQPPARTQQAQAATESVAATQTEEIPTFERYDDAMAWMKDRAKSQGLSVIAYRATDEFKNALSPQLQALYAASKSKWDADTAEAGKAMQDAMAKAGIRPGDTVQWNQPGSFLTTQKLSGVVKLDRLGVPHVHMSSEVAVAKTGGKIGYAKKLRWQPYMQKPAESVVQAVATPVDDAPRRADTAETDSRPAQEATAPQQAAQARFGRDNVPLSDGGKPFKTRKAAGDAKKLQPMMRVVTVPGGYALAEKTPAQLAAEERASRRLRNPNTSARGEPIPAHAFIAAAGGLNRVAASDMGVDGNPRIGNRTLFAGQGRGLSMDQATQMLIQDGYLSEGASINDALDLIKKSLTQPQYNADGIERIAQAEADARFDDYLTALEEAAIDGDFDPFGMADDFTAEELDEVGYTDADPALQAEVEALTAQVEAMGIDTYEILEDIARTYANATQDQYHVAAREALAQAIARGNQDGGRTAAQTAPAAEPTTEQGLTRPGEPATLELAAQTPAEAAAQQDAKEQAAKAEAAAKRAADAAERAEEERKRIAQASVAAADSFELGQDPLDSLTGQGSIFDAPEPAQPQPTAPTNLQEGIAAAQKKAKPAAVGTVDRGGAQGAVNPEIRRSFAGQQAATADTMALATAQQRLDAGEDAEAVRKDTGWFKGADGKWRFEINDADAKLQDRAQWTRQIDKLRARSDEALKAKWDAEEQRNAFLRLRGESPSRISADTKKTPEFKALAKAVKAAEAAAEKARSAVFSAEMGDSLMTVGDVLIHPALFAAYPGVASLKVEINRDLPVGNASYTYETQTIELSEDSDQARLLSTLLHEIQHGIQKIEDFARGGSPNEFRNESADAEMLRDGAILAVMMRSQGTIEKAKTLFVQRFKREPAFGAESVALSGESPESLRSRADNALSPQERYRRLAGEVEARNTQARQGMTDEQRRATPPSQTADVADSDVIVMFNGKVAKSAPLPANAAPDAAQQTPRTSAATIRAAISKAYGKLLGQLEAKGLVTLAQTEAQAVEAAAHARAKKTGGDVAQIKRSLTAAMQGDTDLDVKRSAALSGVTFSDDVEASYAGQTNHTLTAKSKNGVVGVLEYVVYEGVPSISMVSVSEKNRRQGIGRALVQELQSKFPDIEIEWGMLTEDGAALRNSLQFEERPNIDVQRKQNQLEIAVAERSQLEAEANERRDSDDYSAWIQTVSERWNELHDEIDELESDLAAAGPAVRRIVVASETQQSPASIDIKRSANGAVQGFFDPQTGQSFLVADNLSAEAAPGVLMHEVGIHMAADGSMKVLFNRAAMMLKMQKGNPFMKAVQARMDAAGETSGEEAAAYIAEAYENDRANAPASVQRWLADLLAAVKAWMFKKGIMGADRLTVADIAAVARANAKSMARASVADRAGDGDIQFSRASQAKPAEDTANPDSGNSSMDEAGSSAWDAPVQTGFDDVIYKLQDKNIDLKRVVESITKSVGKVADDINAYLKEELFHKRAAKRVADFGARELTPLMNQMRLAGLSMEDVEEYLHARHAKEANAVLAERNPSQAMINAGRAKAAQEVTALATKLEATTDKTQRSILQKALSNATKELNRWNIVVPYKGTEESRLMLSGMSDKDADSYFAKLDPAQRAKLDAVAKKVDAIIAGTRKLYVDYGLEDQAVVDGWASLYKHYIPLMREDKDGGMGIGQGFSVKGKEVKGRTGSTRKVVDILANIASQREKLIVRGEKNRVIQALVGLAQANPNPDFWEVRSQAPTERVVDEATNTVVERPIPNFKGRDNVVVAKTKDSKGNVTEQMVVFNEDNPRAVRMAAALKNLDAGNLEGLLGVSAKITRYFAAINTQYNPVFGVVNLIRDVQGAMVNLAATPLAGQQAKIAKDTFSALRGIYSDIRKTRKGGQATSQWAKLWEQMQDDGGTTGYREMFQTSEDRANNLKSILNPEGWMDSKWGKVFTANGQLKVPMSIAQKGAAEIFGWLSDYNEAMENGVRLAAYKAALDKKMSREQAASIAKNLTVNFNRKGQIGQQAGAVYAFFNAAMQGTARIGQTLFDMDGGDISTLRLSKTGKAVVYGGVTLGVIQALLLAAAGFDDEDPPEFLRERSLIIPVGGKAYVTIPMPLGLHVIPGIGRHATEFALSGFDKPAKRAVSVIGMFADAFNPIGNAGLSMQTLAPTALDPLVALSENKDWTGKPIARVSSNKAMPGHTQWKDTATGFSKVVAEAINWVSGGNEYVAGAFSPTPDQIDYLLAQVGGGVAREAAKVQQTISTAMSGETLPTHKIPLVGRFVGNAASQASQGSAFYANLNKLNELETELKGLRKDGRFDEAAKLARENPQSMMIAMANRAERDVQRLRREKRELIANDASREQVRAKEDQITAVMTRLNEAVERRKAQAAR